MDALVDPPCARIQSQFQPESPRKYALRSRRRRRRFKARLTLGSSAAHQVRRTSALGAPLRFKPGPGHRRGRVFRARPGARSGRRRAGGLTAAVGARVLPCRLGSAGAGLPGLGDPALRRLLAPAGAGLRAPADPAPAAVTGTRRPGGAGRHPAAAAAAARVRGQPLAGPARSATGWTWTPCAAAWSGPATSASPRSSPTASTRCAARCSTSSRWAAPCPSASTCSTTRSIASAPSIRTASAPGTRSSASACCRRASFPLDEEAVAALPPALPRAPSRATPTQSLIYREVSDGLGARGARVLPAAVLRRRPRPCSTICPETPSPSRRAQCREAAERFLADVADRYEQRRHDIERPLLPPAQTLPGRGRAGRPAQPHDRSPSAVRRAVRTPQGLRQDRQLRHPYPAARWRSRHGRHGPPGRCRTFSAEPGRRVLLRRRERRPARDAAGEPARLRHQAAPGGRAGATSSTGDSALALTVAPLEQGLFLERRRHRPRHRDPALRRAGTPGAPAPRRERDGEAVVRNLTELHDGAPGGARGPRRRPLPGPADPGRGRHGDRVPDPGVRQAATSSTCRSPRCT